MIEVHVAALTALTALLLPGMLERRRGAILNVASTAAFQPGPNQAVYCATKAYVLSFTQAWPRRSAARECGFPVWPPARQTPGSRRRLAWQAPGCSAGAAWTPRASPGPGTMACSEANPW